MLKGWAGVVVVCACLALLAFLAFALHADVAIVAGVGAVQLLLAWVMKPPTKEDDKTPPPPLAVLAVIGCAFTIGACTMLQGQKAEAESAYGAEQLQCVDAEPALPDTATPQQRAAARARVDACRAKVRERWQIVETQTSKDGSH